VPAVLRSTQLPLPPAPGGASGTVLDAKYALPRHTAAWWAAHMRGQDFSVEDDLDTEKFNRTLWLGLMGPGVPFPIRTTGQDLSNGREELLKKYRTISGN
jgi:hypothetical protein